MGEAASPALALRDLRRARHHRHRDDVDWVETLYRVYVTVLSGAAVIWFSVSKVTDASAEKGGLADIRHHGAAVLGLVVAYLVALGLRSGSRGGPLSLEAADVRVVLLAPIRRRMALRGPALHQVRSAAFAGVCVGAVVGNLAGHRLPGGFAGWVVGDAAFGGLAAVLWVGAALLACGLRLARPVASLIGVALLAWSATDMAAGAATSPLTRVGRIGLAALTGAVSRGPDGGGDRRRCRAGRRRAGRRRRAARAHVAGDGRAPGPAGGPAPLRSQPAGPPGRDPAPPPPGRRRTPGPPLDPLGDGRRHRPAPAELGWERIAPAGQPEPVRGGLLAGMRNRTSAAVRRRGVHSVLRWPATRLLRVGGLGIVAGFAAGGAWKGTTPLVIVAGAALFVAALDALEPLAQEMDHPTRRDSYPLLPGRLATASLAVPIVVLA